MLPNINLIVGDSNLGRQLQGRDYYSGLVIYSNEPAFTPMQIGSLAEAKANGIGTASNPLAYKLVKDYFDLNNNGLLFVAGHTASAVPDFAEVAALQTYAGNEVRIMAVHTTATYSTSMDTTLQQTLVSMDAYDGYSVGLISAKYTGSYSAMPNRRLTNPKVACVYAKDEAGFAVGKVLGRLSTLPISEAINSVALGDLTVGASEVKYLGDGTDINSVAPSSLEALVNKGYLVPRRFSGYAGTRIALDVTGIIESNDFSTLAANRIMDKAKRVIKVALLPKLSSKVRLNSAGQLRADTIADFVLVVRQALRGMVNDDDLADFSVVIPANQNILQTGVLNINVGLLMNGIANQINVNLGFVLKVSA